jgi:hypothetical protein
MWDDEFPGVAEGVRSTGGAGLFQVWIIAAGVPGHRGEHDM